MWGSDTYCITEKTEKTAQTLINTRNPPLSDPLNHFYEMVLVLVQGGYDIPDQLYPYTPKGRAEAEEDLSNDEDLFLY